MTLKNCDSCGQLHNERGIYCSTCRETERKIFARVRDYLYDNPNGTVKEVAENTGIKPEKIRKYVREGRLLSSGFEQIQNDHQNKE